jgi:hypothetical protein
MSDKVAKKTKAQLLAMLAEAVRNTQPQPDTTQPEPKRKTQSRNKRPPPKRAAKIKRTRR